MLQQNNFVPFPVVWEKGTLSEMLNTDSIPRGPTSSYKPDRITVRTQSLNKGHDATVTAYHVVEWEDTQHNYTYKTRLMASLYGTKRQVELNGHIDLDRLDDFVQVLKDIREKLDSLKS